MSKAVLLLLSGVLSVSASFAARADVRLAHPIVRMQVGAAVAAPLGLVLFCQEGAITCDAEAPRPQRIFTTEPVRIVRAPDGFAEISSGQTGSCSALAYWDTPLGMFSTSCGQSALAAVALSSPAEAAFETAEAPSIPDLALASLPADPSPDRVNEALELALAEAALGRGPDTAPFTDRQASDARVDLNTLERVNVSINRAIRPADDFEVYGVKERWGLPLETMGADAKGNCKHYAMEKRRALIALGVSTESLSLALAIAPGFGRHIVLIVSTAQGDVVMDNLTDRLRRVDQTGYRWLAMQSGPGLLEWAAVKPARVESPTTELAASGSAAVAPSGL